MIDIEAMMGLALSEARRAAEAGDVPVGAVACDADGVVVARAHNERQARHDPVAHAEILALQAASASRGGWRLDDLTLVVTLEPCAMCAGALVNARIGALVFGAHDPKAGACGSLYNVASDPRLNHEFPVTGGVLAEECAEILERFFASRR